jgi:hypothetical protein
VSGCKNGGREDRWTHDDGKDKLTKDKPPIGQAPNPYYTASLPSGHEHIRGALDPGLTLYGSVRAEGALSRNRATYDAITVADAIKVADAFKVACRV